MPGVKTESDGRGTMENASFATSASWLRRLASCGIAAVVATALAGSAAGQTPGRKAAPAGRAPPPGGNWDRVTADTFLPDAFSTIQGSRPVTWGDRRGSQPLPPKPDTPDNPGAVSSADGFKWSALVSEDTLTDEIKDMKPVIAAACAKPTDFKGGGFADARLGFSSLALAFAVIDAHDQDVRWKKHAATARDLFARAGANCKAGTDQSFAESKARLEDLEALLDGNAPQGRPDREGDFLWSAVATRPALMGRLEGAQDAMRPAVASKADFGGKLDALRHAVEIIAVVGEVIQRPDYEHHDDDTYRGYAAAMRDAAVEARAACEKKDYEAARAAVGKIEKSCDACHGDYRS